MITALTRARRAVAPGRHGRDAHVRAVASALPVPRPWDLDVFLARLRAHRGRGIEVHPLEGDGGPDMPSGLWVPTAGTDHIFAETATSPAHREHIVCHELGHMILGHEPDPARPGQARRPVFTVIDPELVGRSRAGYAQSGERDAELLATLILDRAHHGAPGPGWDGVLGFG